MSATAPTSPNWRLSHHKASSPEDQCAGPCPHINHSERETQLYPPAHNQDRTSAPDSRSLDLVASLAESSVALFRLSNHDPKTGRSCLRQKRLRRPRLSALHSKAATLEDTADSEDARRPSKRHTIPHATVPPGPKSRAGQHCSTIGDSSEKPRRAATLQGGMAVGPDGRPPRLSAHPRCA